MRVISPIKVTDSNLIASNVPENDFPEWSAATAYTTGQKVIVLATHRIYEALQNSTGVNPVGDTTDTWLDIGATNRWRAFDAAVESQTENPEKVSFTFEAGDSWQGLALLNMVGEQVRVLIDDPIEGPQQAIERDLFDNSNVVDWWTYFFAPNLRLQDIIFQDLPVYRNAEITIEVIDSAVAKLGELVLGPVHILGTSTTGGQLGIEDFSTKERDTFGNTIILERAFANRVSFQFAMPIQTGQRVRRILADLRARPAVYFVSTDLVSYGANVYGFPSDFRINLETPVIAFASLEIEGLT